MNATFPLLAAVLTASPTTEIKVDQAGYLPSRPKIAFVVSKAAAATFVVRRARDGGVAFEGRLAAPADDADSGDLVRAADFTKLTEPGSYYLDVAGAGRSWDFSVAENVYARALYLALRSFYGQRCGTAVDLGPAFPGYAYRACHREGAWHPSSGRTGPRPSTRGWHDAGDYGRYVVNSGITTGTLLWTWELFESRLRDLRLDIPESGDATPDLLHEIRWNLDWMLSMQDEDGGVWHKQTSEAFPGFVMPDQDKAVSLVAGIGREPWKGSCATADFAAVMAIAGRVYRPFDPVYAEGALRAARRAWTWLDAHPDVVFRNPPGVTTGAYGDEDCRDERLWAAAELWRTTGDEAFHRHFLAHAAEHEVHPAGPQGWANVAPMALWTYALGRGANAGTLASIRRASLDAADRIVERSALNGYRISLTTGEYGWGSNGIAANYGVQLLVTNALRPDRRYVEAALDDLHYLLGRNTFSLSWVTQVGANPYRHPHHRPSGADGQPEPWPGLLSGGPNQRREDAVLGRMPDLPPAKTYADEEGSYASNEVAINWNAALVFLLAGALTAR
jgi:endoglucanase